MWATHLVLGQMGWGWLTCVEHRGVDGNVRARARTGNAKVAEALGRLGGRVEGDDRVLTCAVCAIGQHDVRGVGRLHASRDTQHAYPWRPWVVRCHGNSLADPHSRIAELFIPVLPGHRLPSVDPDIVIFS